ncbi:hypothetical protein L596_012890 [Steinernema carpocapsae]|uniref:Uncharacterized protein n=1 Tax=Steinernema carpocapsae TaxID=34508 RepID=A0A4U5NZE1_STECR|nr:hypothetical protein L596_012890 [Steinernema carpocapsae]
MVASPFAFANISLSLRFLRFRGPFGQEMEEQRTTALQEAAVNRLVRQWKPTAGVRKVKAARTTVFAMLTVFHWMLLKLLSQQAKNIW